MSKKIIVNLSAISHTGWQQLLTSSLFKNIVISPLVSFQFQQGAFVDILIVQEHSHQLETVKAQYLSLSEVDILIVQEHSHQQDQLERQWAESQLLTSSLFKNIVISS